MAFTHPVVVLKSGLKNNWMKKLNHVIRPLDDHFFSVSMKANKRKFRADVIPELDLLLKNKGGSKKSNIN